MWLKAPSSTHRRLAEQLNEVAPPAYSTGIDLLVARGRVIIFSREKMELLIEPILVY
jgi:hypothetical protein